MQRTLGSLKEGPFNTKGAPIKESPLAVDARDILQRTLHENTVQSRDGPTMGSL